MDNGIFQIIVDSCADFLDNPLRGDDYVRIPFTITVDGQNFVDRELDIDTLLLAMKERVGQVLTACPSPADFLSAISESAHSFIVTISSKLSGSYTSALAARDIYLDENKDNKDKKIHVIDSKSAAAAENLILLKLRELIQNGFSYNAIVDETTKFVSKMRTLFVLESLENLVKNGRISKANYLIGSALRVVPVMGENGDGEIELHAKAIGRKGALRKLVELIGKHNVDYANSVLGITHINALERAIEVKDAIQSAYNFKEVLIFKSGGLSTVYGDDGGIILAFPTV